MMGPFFFPPSSLPRCLPSDADSGALLFEPFSCMAPFPIAFFRVDFFFHFFFLISARPPFRTHCVRWTYPFFFPLSGCNASFTRETKFPFFLFSPWGPFALLCGAPTGFPLKQCGPFFFLFFKELLDLSFLFFFITSCSKPLFSPTARVSS